MFRRSRVSLAAALAVGGVAMLATSGVIAQDSGQRVEVTGSRIKRVDAETASPVQIITREELDRSGKTSIQDVLRGVTSDSNGSIPTSFTNGFASGSAAISLRGLGVNSTLVLVNGRRMSTYGLADDGVRTFVDLNSIPLEAVEQVEVFKGGASAIYGADAVGGVVNIKLKKSYTGGSIGGSYGQTGKSDGQTTRAFGSVGFGNLDTDKFNVFATIEASKQKNIWAKDRGFIGDTDLTRFGYYDLTNGLPPSVSRRRRRPHGQLAIRCGPKLPVPGSGPRANIIRATPALGPGPAGATVGLCKLQRTSRAGSAARDRPAQPVHARRVADLVRHSAPIWRWGTSTPRPSPTVRWAPTTTPASSYPAIRSIRWSSTAR